MEYISYILIFCLFIYVVRQLIKRRNNNKIVTPIEYDASLNQVINDLSCLQLTDGSTIISTCGVTVRGTPKIPTK